MALKWPSVAWGLRNISASELNEWAAFYELDPFGEWRDDYRAGMVVSMLANIHRDPEKRSQPYLPTDFIPEFGDQAEERKQTPDEMLAMVEILNLQFGGEDLRGK